MSQAQTIDSSKPAKWRSLEEGSFIRRSFAHWFVHDKVLTPTEDEAEEMKGLNLEFYEFPSKFITDTKQYCAIA